MVEKVEVVRVGKARRAKLYYLRDRIGKAAKTKEDTGARIENKEITIKEDIPEVAPVEEAAVETEATVAEETPATEEAKAEAPVEEVKEEKTAEEKEDKKEDK